MTLATASLIRQLTFFSPTVALGVSGGYRWEALRSIFLPESPLEIFFLIGYGISPNHRGLGGVGMRAFWLKLLVIGPPKHACCTGGDSGHLTVSSGRV